MWFVDINILDNFLVNRRNNRRTLSKGTSLLLPLKRLDLTTDVWSRVFDTTN